MESLSEYLVVTHDCLLLPPPTRGRAGEGVTPHGTAVNLLPKPFQKKYCPDFYRPLDMPLGLTLLFILLALVLGFFLGLERP